MGLHTRLTRGIRPRLARKQSSLSGKESAQGCIPKRLLGRPDYRNASSGKSVGMDADWGIDETAKITRNGKPVSAYECMLEGQKSWNAKYEKITGQKAELSWENVTSHVHPEAYRNMEILKANGADAKMRDLLNRTSLADAQQIADVTRFKADEMLNGKQFPRLVYVREAARGSAKDLGGKFLPAIEAILTFDTRQ